MGALTVQKILKAGTAPNFSTDTPTAADTADVGDGRNTFLVYKNTDAASRTVTIKMDHRTLVTGDTHADKEYTLAATSGEVWIPLLDEYADPDGAGVNTCDVTLTPAVAGVTVALVRAEW